MKTLVTGTPGWLGTRLTEVLSTGWNGIPKIKARSVQCLVQNGIDISPIKKYPVEIVRGDVRKKESLEGIMCGVDTVFHTVGLIHPKKTKELFEVNYRGTTNLLNLAIENKVKRFIYVSSNSPAGCNLSREILMKEYDKVRPYKKYGKSKLKAEQVVQQAYKEGKIETVIIRPCWFYGPNQPPRQTRFFSMIKAGKPIIFGRGKNLRSMSYIDNVIQGILLAEKSDKAVGNTYWIADKKPYEMLEIYSTISKLLDVELNCRFFPGVFSTICELVDTVLQFLGMYSTNFHVAGEMNKNIACSIEKAEKELEYKPQIEIYEGMRRSIEWCRQNGINI